MVMVRGGRGGAGCEHRLVGGVQERLRSREERRAGRAQAAALGGALQQAYAERVLQPLDLAAQGGLGDVQRRRRPGEVQVLGDDREVPHQAQVEVQAGTDRRGGQGFVIHAFRYTAAA
ncbi:hypothetical protein GCM10020220_039060 [Nonomuraea rubra]